MNKNGQCALNAVGNLISSLHVENEENNQTLITKQSIISKYILSDDRLCKFWWEIESSWSEFGNKTPRKYRFFWSRFCIFNLKHWNALKSPIRLEGFFSKRTVTIIVVNHHRHLRLMLAWIKIYAGTIQAQRIQHSARNEWAGSKCSDDFRCFYTDRFRIRASWHFDVSHWLSLTCRKQQSKSSISEFMHFFFCQKNE